MYMELVFEQTHKGFVVKAFRTGTPDAHVEVTRDGQPFTAFDYPAYRIWNIAAHFTAMVDDYLESPHA